MSRKKEKLFFVPVTGHLRFEDFLVVCEFVKLAPDGSARPVEFFLSERCEAAG